MFHGRISLNSGSAAASEFCEWVQVGIDHKYQVKPRSSPNHLFCLYQQNKSSKSRVKCRQASNHCKRVLEVAKLLYGTKTKEFITSQKLGSWDFWQIANIVLSKGKSAIPPLFGGVVFCI